MKVTVEQLVLVTRAVLKHLNDLRYSEIVLDETAYWHVLLRDMMDLTKQPKDLGVGSLVDDWSELERLLSDTADVGVTDLRPLGFILLALATSLHEGHGHKH